MRTEEEIVKRIGVLTATIGRMQDELYDMALRNKHRHCIYELHLIDKKVMRCYNELMVLEWVLGKEGR